MPMFGPKFAPGTEGPSLSNSAGVTGLQVQPPEVPGSMARRSRMFGEAIRLAESSPDLGSAIGTLLAKEPTFVKWVSLRGGHCLRLDRSRRPEALARRSHQLCQAATAGWRRGPDPQLLHARVGEFL